MTDTDPTKRIPKSLGTDAKLVGTYTLTDLAVGLLPGVVVVLGMQVLLPSSVRVYGYSPQTLTLPLAGLAIACGALFVYLTPGYTTSLDWLGTFVGFQRNTHDLPHEEAKQYTLLERIHPAAGAIERTDGAFVGLVQVTPPPMALATDEEWASKADAFRDFCNTTVQFPIQLFSTTQPFPVDEYLGRYEARLEDEDVAQNPRLEALIEHYVEWYEDDLEDRRMTIRDHYVVVAVTPREVQFDRESLAQKLAALPLLGLAVRALTAPRRAEQRAAMFEALDERLQQMEAGLREIEDCSATRVDVAEATTLLAEYWHGDDHAHGDPAWKLRTGPLVGGPE